MPFRSVSTYYDILKVAPDAPVEVIRAAYRSLCQMYHPDRHGGDPEAAKRMSAINAAYEVLSDPIKKAAHDEVVALREAQRTSPTRTAPAPGTRLRHRMTKNGWRGICAAAILLSVASVSLLNARLGSRDLWLERAWQSQGRHEGPTVSRTAAGPVVAFEALKLDTSFKGASRPVLDSPQR